MSTDTEVKLLAKAVSDSDRESKISLPGSDSSDHDEPIDMRHNDLWFSDGSVVLRAEQTLFRVHMSQLSRHSLLFRDMFTLPQPSTASEPSPSAIHSPQTDLGYIEGCPVIHLHDKAEDLANLLIALYDGPTFGNNDRSDFRVVSGILRLSAKYIIDSLRAKALAHLSEAWPSTLKAWDLREDLARVYELETGTPRGFRYPSPIVVINLAREIDALSLLPSAFYDLSRYSYTQIFEPREESPLCDDLSTPHDSRCHLSLLDIQKLGMASGGRNRTNAICTTASACRSDFLELAQLATQHYIFDREKGCADPLYVAEELGQLKSAETTDGEDCVACARSLEAWAVRERERLWKTIPTWFRLDSS
ncbi:unnamed protein product [Somion occarium]|uniref:BTB domain-containing protein n=1 Tax=Somion occarium TaxID=3059160 RepID=A0ABP1E6S6_9APHY